MVEITYHKEGDYFIPDLFLEKEEYAKDYNKEFQANKLCRNRN